MFQFAVLIVNVLVFLDSEHNRLHNILISTQNIIENICLLDLSRRQRGAVSQVMVKNCYFTAREVLYSILSCARPLCSASFSLYVREASVRLAS